MTWIQVEVINAVFEAKEDGIRNAAEVVAEKFGIARSCVSEWFKDKDKYLKLDIQKYKNLQQIRPQSLSRYHVYENKLFEEFLERRYPSSILCSCH